MTGLDGSFFVNSDENLLKAILPMLADENVKALTALILRLKDNQGNKEIYDYLMADIVLKDLAPKVRSFFIKNKSTDPVPISAEAK